MAGPGVDVYFSVDIEADGPIPGPYSMLALGICVCGWFDGETFGTADPDEFTFYAELAPISDDYVEEAMAIAGLDRTELARTGETPLAAMTRAAAWVEEIAAGAHPVFVGWPAAYDWLFTHWYFMKFLGRDPFGYSSYVDMKSFYIARSRLRLDDASPNYLPPELQATRPHTHNALDDAQQQGEFFARLFDWHRAR